MNLPRNETGTSATTFIYFAENRLTAVTGPATASFFYDADGGRVKTTFGSTTTIYVGGHYEKTGSAVTKYYYAGGRRVAMRTGGQTYYLFPDHLGSTHVTANSSGAQVGRLLYRPWGEARSIEGTPQTNWRFAGQREDATIGLYFYNARYYDPVLGRFTQPDTIVPDPGDPQALNRYSYVLNNPVLYIDPSGHAYDASGAAGPSCSDGSASYLACTYPPSHPLAGYWIGVPRRRNANANWGSCHTQTCSPRRAHDPAVHNPKHSAASLH